MFKTKMHIDDILNRFKVEFIIKEFSQMYNINYMNILGSTVKSDILRLFLVIITLKNLKCY